MQLPLKKNNKKKINQSHSYEKQLPLPDKENLLHFVFFFFFFWIIRKCSNFQRREAKRSTSSYPHTTQKTLQKTQTTPPRNTDKTKYKSKHLIMGGVQY